jgi:hypothetical protein
MDRAFDNDALGDAYLPSPVKRVKQSAFLKLQEKWESGRVLRHQNSSDSIADVLGKLTIQRDDEDATEVTEAESCCSSDEGPLRTSSMSQKWSPATQTCDDGPVMVKSVRFADTSKPEIIAIAGPTDKVYPRWEFGKKKTFAWPTISKRTHRAATEIQRVTRGGMARLHFKIQKLEWMLETRDDRTQSAIAKIAERTERRKNEFMKQVQKQNDDADRKRRCYEALAQEQQKVVEYLRVKNRQEREKLAKYQAANGFLRQQNERMENSRNQAEGTFWSLNDHTQTIVEQHKKLTKAVQKYKLNIAVVQAAIQERDAHMSTEHRIKTLYRHAMGEIAVRLEESPKAAVIAERVTTLCVALENMEAASSGRHTFSPPASKKKEKKHRKSRRPSLNASAPQVTAPTPRTKRRQSLGAFLGSEAQHHRGEENEGCDGDGDGDGDDASLDNYTIHTMNDL